MVDLLRVSLLVQIPLQVDVVDDEPPHFRTQLLAFLLDAVWLYIAALLQHVAIDAQDIEKPLRGVVQQGEVGVFSRDRVVHHYAEVHVLGNHVAEDCEDHHAPELPTHAHVDDGHIHGLVGPGHASTSGASGPGPVLHAEMAAWPRPLLRTKLVQLLPQIPVALAIGIGRKLRHHQRRRCPLIAEMLREDRVHHSAARGTLHAGPRVHLRRWLGALQQHRLEDHCEGQLREHDGDTDRTGRVLIGDEDDHLSIEARHLADLPVHTGRCPRALVLQPDSDL
mmetsp:Transcript_58952/g.126705  ORF Transcript_58952/g.126705 Transcript_58952/m.126705 type:complete len:280 (-) Transcript_58952:1082-1921(-)